MRLLSLGTAVLLLCSVLAVAESQEVENRERKGGPIWGLWSEWSVCSRTCGGGVYFQERQCLSVRNVILKPEKCDGPARVYESCNIQDCPEGSKDFRQEQCSSFNEVAYDGVFFTWMPFLGGSSQHCQLNCMPKGENFYYTQAETVVDGTRCQPDSLDICVAGKCKKVGCDMMLNSTVQLDKCGECDGDNSSCEDIIGEFITKNLEIGEYNDVVTLPVGATSIMIREQFYSGNFLSLRSVHGEYYINGDYRVSYPQSFQAAGTTFHYERHGSDGQGTLEVFQSPGPLTEAVAVMLLTQGPNTGIAYEYSVPVGYEHDDPYVWSVGSYEECSVDCGGGLKHRDVYCTRRINSEVVADHYCSGDIRPASNSSCNVDLCPPSWHTGEWSECPMTCAGDGVMQQRNVVCMRHTATNDREYADTEECVRVAGPEPDHFQLCNEDVPCPQWYTDDWSECSEPCGPGVQTRTVTCGHVNDVGDFDCDEADKPLTEQTCVERPCSDLKWMVATDWTKCSGSCGESMQSREVVCVDSIGKVYPEETCGNLTKPQIMQHCELRKNKCKPKWVSTDWTQCSASCGKGVRSRFVFCATLKRDRWVEVPAKRCKEEKPVTMESCGNGPCETGTWMTGDWSECSVTCEAGRKERSVICFLNGHHEDDEFCKTSNKPDHTRRCVIDVICPDDGSDDEELTTRSPTESPTPERAATEFFTEYYEDFCSVHQETGPCRDFKIHWYFDQQYSQCARFWYGGCDGNDNRFSTQIACEAACIADREKLSQEDLCSLPSDSGPCRGNYPSYFYNKETYTCEPFTFGGCKGNQNRFSGEDECEIVCGTFNKDPCSLAVDTGRCQEPHDLWYYEIYSDRCLPFVYSGCFGNPNRFSDKASCENRCVQHPVEEIPDGAVNICTLPAETGDCGSRTLKWFYNTETRLCESFTYSGCHGNENNFETQDKCLQMCSSGVSIVYPQTTTVKSTTESVLRIEFTVPPTKQPTLRTDTSDNQGVLHTSPFPSIRPRTKCEHEREDTSMRGAIGQFIPRCTEEGLYQRAQCHGSTGYCFCVNEITGNRYEDSYIPFNRPDCDRLYYSEGKDTVTVRPDTEVKVPTTAATDLQDQFIRLEKPLNNITKLRKGEKVSLRCYMTGNPAVEYRWFKNHGLLIGNEDRMTIKQFHWGSRLSIDDAQTYDAGFYECRGHNTAGELSTMGIIVFSAADVEAPVIIVDVANVTILSPGATFKATCEATGNPPPMVVWYRNGIRLSDLGGKRLSDKAGKLKVREIVQADAGEYVCTADNGVGTASHAVALHIEEELESDLTSRETKVTVHQGEDVDLECSSAQDYQIAISWQTAGRYLIGQDRRFTQRDDDALHISSVQLADAGSYICTGRIGHSVVLRKYYNLVVQADADIVRAPRDKQATVGDLIEFFCDSTGSPTPVTEWFLNDIQVVENSRVSIGPFGSLTINGVKSSDDGTYTCIVSNGISHREATASLEVSGGSEPDPDCVDDPEKANCSLIAIAGLCDTRFGDFCCRTCRDNDN